MCDEVLPNPTPISNRGGHALDAFCASGLSPPDDDEIDINRLVEELADLAAELFIDGKLEPEPKSDDPQQPAA